MRSFRVAGFLRAACVLVATAPILGGCASFPNPFRAPTRAELAAERQHAKRLAAEAAEAARKAVSPEERLALADRMRRSGRIDKAALAYLSAYERDPSDPVPQERIAFMQVSRKPEKAEEIFESILREVPDRSSAHAGLGLAHYAQGDLKPAQNALERAVELAPDDVLALNTLAVVYDMLERHEEAQHYYLKVRELRPRDPRAANNMGVSLLLLGDFVAAEAELRLAVDLDPEDPAGWNNLGLALGHLERYKEALDAFRKGGDEQGARNNLGYVYFLNGRYAKAIEEYEAALLEGGNATPTVLENLDAAVDAAEDR